MTREIQSVRAIAFGRQMLEHAIPGPASAGKPVQQHDWFATAQAIVHSDGGLAHGHQRIVGPCCS